MLTRHTLYSQVPGCVELCSDSSPSSLPSLLNAKQIKYMKRGGWKGDARSQDAAAPTFATCALQKTLVKVEAGVPKGEGEITVVVQSRIFACLMFFSALM